MLCYTSLHYAMLGYAKQCYAIILYIKINKDGDETDKNTVEEVE